MQRKQKLFEGPPPRSLSLASPCPPPFLRRAMPVGPVAASAGVGASWIGTAATSRPSATLRLTPSGAAGLAIEQIGAAANSWLTEWGETADRSLTHTFAKRRERMRRLGAEVVASKHGCQLPKRGLGMSKPLDPGAVLRHHPETRHRAG